MKKRYYYIVFMLLAVLAGAEYFLQTRLTWEKENKRLGGAEAYLYYHPAPPAKKWAAIYSSDFAKKFGLPANRISQELNNEIEYMEVISVPARKLNTPDERRHPKQDCILNILANKRNDIPLDEPTSNIKRITEAQRIENQKIGIADYMKRIDKPLQFINTNNKHEASYRSISALSFIHSSNLLPEYDYFSKLDFRCQSFLSSLRQDKDISYNRFLRASVIAKKSQKSFQPYLENEQRTVSVDRNDDSSFITIIVPKSLSKLLYEGTEVPPEPTYALVNGIIDVPKLIVALPFALMMGLGAPDVTEANKAPVNISLAAPWPEDTPTHFKLENND